MVSAGRYNLLISVDSKETQRDLSTENLAQVRHLALWLPSGLRMILESKTQLFSRK